MGSLDNQFRGIHYFDQSILSVIIANWVRKKVHNIPLEYPGYYYSHKNIVKWNDYNYLKYLNN